MSDIKEKCENLLIDSVRMFFNTPDEAKEKLYYKGLSEGMMQILKSVKILTTQELESVVANAKLHHEEALHEQPTYKRIGRSDLIKSFQLDDKEKI